MITKAEYDAMTPQQRWDIFNAMQWELAQYDASADEALTPRVIPDERPIPYESDRNT